MHNRLNSRSLPPQPPLPSATPFVWDFLIFLCVSKCTQPNRVDMFRLPTNRQALHACRLQRRRLRREVGHFFIKYSRERRRENDGISKSHFSHLLPLLSGSNMLLLQAQRGGHKSIPDCSKLTFFPHFLHFSTF